MKTIKWIPIILLGFTLSFSQQNLFAQKSDSFQNAEAFLKHGGRKGRQTGIMTPGSYRNNTFLFHHYYPYCI